MTVDGKRGPEPRGELTPKEKAEIAERSDALGRKLNEARETRQERSRSKAVDPGQSKAIGRAFRLSAELIGSLVVGSAIGWYLDGVFKNEKPYLFIVFFLLGAAAGILNVVRVAMREKTPPLPSVPDEREEDK